MTTLPCQHKLEEIESKLDRIIEMLESANGIKGFSLNLLANIIGNAVDGNKQ